MVTWPSALAWRLERQLLDPVRTTGAAEVVGALRAVAAQLDPAWSELGVRLRSGDAKPGELSSARDAGAVVATFAFRGAVHLMTPGWAAVHCALRASSRMWERASWREYYCLEPGDWPRLIATVRDALSDGPLTRAELADAVTATPAYVHLMSAFTDPSATFLKPLAWNGALVLGPSRAGRATFQLPETSPGWPGLPDLDVAGPRAIEGYLHAYGPASRANLSYWLSEGLGVRARLVDDWLRMLGRRVSAVDVEGEQRLVLSDDLDALTAARPAATVRLLPKYDQWVLGPGTADGAVVPPALRQQVSRGSHLIVVDGVVSGTWALAGETVVPTWAPGAGTADPDLLAAEVERLGDVLGRPLGLGEAR